MHGLDLRDWLLVDPETFAEQMGAKELALGTQSRRPEVLQISDAASLGAQEEVRQLVYEHLVLRYPEHYVRRSETHMGVAVNGYEREVDAAACEGPLEAAARLVLEDLVLMQRSGGEAEGAEPEYRMAAAAVAFSFGDLPKRTSQRHSMARLHEKVGNYERDLHKPVSRALASLKIGSPMWRTNWTFSFTGSMAPHPDRYLLNLEKRARIFPSAPVTEWDGADGAVRRIDARGAGEAIYLKTEYQTLRRLPRHEAFVLFTVRTYMTPLKALEAQPYAAALLAENVRGALHLDFRYFKGLDDERVATRILTYRRFARSRPSPRRFRTPRCSRARTRRFGRILDGGRIRTNLSYSLTRRRGRRRPSTPTMPLSRGLRRQLRWLARKWRCSRKRTQPPLQTAVSSRGTRLTWPSLPR